MPAIVTKFHAPSRGVMYPRITARAVGETLWLSWQSHLSTEDNHKIAMLKLARQNHWFGQWTMAILPSSSKYEYCFVPHKDRHESRRAILVEPVKTITTDRRTS